MPWISELLEPLPESDLPLARGARSWTTVFGGSSGDGLSSLSSPEPDLRRRRRRRRLVAPSPEPVSSSAVSESSASSSESSSALSADAASDLSDLPPSSPPLSAPFCSPRPRPRPRRPRRRRRLAGPHPARRRRRSRRRRIRVVGRRRESSSLRSPVLSDFRTGWGATKSGMYSGRSTLDRGPPASAATRARPPRSGARLGRDDRRGDCRRRAGQQVADANRVDAFHGGMSTADPAVELGQRVEHLPAGRPQRPRQGVDP